MTTEVLVVRHGETAWNKEGRLQGQHDPPLNDQGRTQVEAVARYLATQSRPSAAVYTSDLVRAEATAVAISERVGAKVVVKGEFREKGETSPRAVPGFPGQRFCPLPPQSPKTTRVADVLPPLAARAQGWASSRGSPSQRRESRCPKPSTGKPSSPQPPSPMPHNATGRHPLTHPHNLSLSLSILSPPALSVGSHPLPSPPLPSPPQQVAQGQGLSWRRGPHRSQESHRKRSGRDRARSPGRAGHRGHARRHPEFDSQAHHRDQVSRKNSKHQVSHQE